MLTFALAIFTALLNEVWNCRYLKKGKTVVVDTLR
jgi:hypothetical protein